MKEMSTRDKMIIIIITIIVILVAGFFALIKPKYQALVADTATLATTQTEWDGIEAKLNAIPGLKDTITQKYNDSNKTAQIFVNEAQADLNKNYTDEMANLAAAKHLKPVLDDANLEVRNMEISGAAAEMIQYFYYTPNVVTYSLLEAADINGNYAEEIADKLMVSTVLGETETAEVLANVVTLTVVGEKENLMTFLDAIKADKNAILVKHVKVSDYTFVGGLDEEEDKPQPVQTPVEQEFDEEGNPIEPVEVAPEPVATPASEEELAEGYSEMELDVVFYNAKPIDKPDLGD